MAAISVPIHSRLPSSLRLGPASPVVTRVLGRLSRPSLLSLALDWLDESNQALTAPYLRQRRRRRRRITTEEGEEYEVEEEEEDEDEDEDDFYPPASSLEALREHYADLQARRGSKREVLDRVLEGDWRWGVSLYQLAMADLQYLYDHPTSQRWTAFRLVPLKPEEGGEGDDDAVSASVDKASLAVPRFHPSSFLRRLQAQILPDVKVHYNFDRHKDLPLLLLRIFVLDSPYNTSLATAAAEDGSGSGSGSAPTVEAARTVYVAFPDAAPFVYLSSAQSFAPAGEQAPGASALAQRPSASSSSSSSSNNNRETRSLRSLVVEALPKALSHGSPPQRAAAAAAPRYALKPTSLAARSLATLVQRCGPGRTNAAGGGWSVYADEAQTALESPLSAVPPPPVGPKALLDAEADKENAREGVDANKESTATKTTNKRPAAPGVLREQRLAKRRNQVAAARFGLSAKMGDGCGVERVDVVMQDPFPGGGRFDPDDDEEGEIEEARAAASSADRRRSRGGRRGHIDAVLAREEEEEEENELVHRRGAGEDERDARATTSESAWRPRVAFTFHGPHVFAGIRQLVEAGIIDGEKMPGWLTGEDGVTVGAVRDGRIRGHKGSGML